MAWGYAVKGTPFLDNCSVPFSPWPTATELWGREAPNLYNSSIGHQSAQLTFSRHYLRPVFVVVMLLACTLAAAIGSNQPTAVLLGSGSGSNKPYIQRLQQHQTMHAIYAATPTAGTRHPFTNKSSHDAHKAHDAPCYKMVGKIGHLHMNAVHARLAKKFASSNSSSTVLGVSSSGSPSSGKHMAPPANSNDDGLRP